MEASRLHRLGVLAEVPHRAPFRFIDEISALDENAITGSYRFRENEAFYAGHFPGNPITPGVILIETMAQIGVVALGIYLAATVDGKPTNDLTMVFTESNVEFSHLVKPGERVIVKGEKIYYRRSKLKVKVEMTLEDGTLVCCGELAGMSVAPTKDTTPA